MNTSEVRRLTARVLVSDGCWEWTGSRNRQGYGRFSYEGGRFVFAHRYMFELFFGQIPQGMLVCHRCDNPSCVRPEHLFAGSARDNALDREAKGRGFEASQQVCQRGHAFVGENVYIHPQTGARNCRTCRNENSRRNNAKRRRKQ